MKWPARLLGYVPSEEREGIHLPPGPHWEVGAPAEFAAFLRGVGQLAPSGSVLYLEGGIPSKEVRSYLKEHTPTTVTRVSMGAIWPRPECFHVEITPGTLEGLATLAEEHGMWEFGWHVHVYKGETMLVEWYDAPDDPLWISRDIPEEPVACFSAELGTQYRKEDCNEDP